ncbi:septum formation family protein [Dactylosporangium vinaceum]|uniref:Septum formation family protein n=1 Tax=Dactylosporangium vinaceum TaxID=53362 RepID=A0ABV5MMF3_9ACTN|nr:septum formation family protein [Dactylosporangium vinaceum]UAB93266.1 septum formation family protein [Dactylosporangium vinaceum]
MRPARAIRTAAAVLLLTSALAGCAKPGGTDGDLLDDWAMLGAAKVPEPVVGQCRDSTGLNAYDPAAFDGPFKDVPCDGPHQFEIVATGQLPADLAASGERPGRDRFAALFPQCEDLAAKYLGGEWQAGRLYLYLQPPSTTQWRGGARFFHCDVAAIGPDGDTIEPATTSVKDAVRAAGPLAQGCFVTAGADADNLFATATPIACDQPHDMEYAGYVTAPAKSDYPKTDDANDDLFGTACENKMLAYLGMSRATYDRQKDIYYVWWRPSGQAGWNAGEHSSRCYFLLHNRKLSRSVKGIGDATL